MSAPAAGVIAIIDDDDLHCRSLSRLLHRAGFHPLIFHSAEEFLAASERGFCKCLLLDIQLGAISGFALHRQLLAQGDQTPVIYLTAHDDSSSRSKALSIGCAGFFSKTDASSTIIEALRAIT